jgi:hypothetical protein
MQKHRRTLIAATAAFSALVAISEIRMSSAAPLESTGARMGKVEFNRADVTLRAINLACDGQIGVPRMRSIGE